MHMRIDAMKVAAAVLTQRNCKSLLTTLGFNGNRGNPTALALWPAVLPKSLVVIPAMEGRHLLNQSDRCKVVGSAVQSLELVIVS